MNILFAMLVSVTAPYEDITAVNFGIKIGYQYESLTLKNVRIDLYSEGAGANPQLWNWDSTYKPVGKIGESKTLMGFGGEIIGEVVMCVPGLPIGIEVDLGKYTSGYTNPDTLIFPPVICNPQEPASNPIVDTLPGFDYTINSTRFSFLGKFFIRHWESVYPWIGIGPVIGLNTHTIRVAGELAPVLDFNGTKTTCKSVARASTGVCAEIGARVWIINRVSIDAGIRLDYFTNAVASWQLKDHLATDYTYDFKYSQYNARFMVGAHYLFKW